VSRDQNPVEKAVELLVFAPVGVAMFAKDTLPTFLKMFVARGHTELEQRRRELAEQAHQYKTIGRFAVRYGGPEARRQAEATLGGARRQAGATVDGVRRKAQASLSGIAPARPAADRNGSGRDTGGDRARPPAAPRARERSSPTENGRTRPPDDAGATLPIPGYDQLSASQVVARLDGLAPDELDTIRTYESAHRGRNTILGKIAQLTT